jgi:hypothetical protein
MMHISIAINKKKDWTVQGKGVQECMSIVKK